VNPRRLYRSRSDRQLAGVAAGMAEYLDIDPTVVRILWILAAVLSAGMLILAYIVLAFVIPEAPFGVTPNQGWTAPTGPAPAGTAPAQGWSTDWQTQANAERQARERSRGRGPGAAVIVGTLLIVFGVIALADAVLPAWVDTTVFGPALVIALGAALLVGALRRSDTSAPAPASVSSASSASASSSGWGSASAGAPAPASATPSASASAFDPDGATAVIQPDATPR